MAPTTEPIMARALLVARQFRLPWPVPASRRIARKRKPRIEEDEDEDDDDEDRFTSPPVKKPKHAEITPEKISSGYDGRPVRRSPREATSWKVDYKDPPMGFDSDEFLIEYRPCVLYRKQTPAAAVAADAGSGEAVKKKEMKSSSNLVSDTKRKKSSAAGNKNSPTEPKREAAAKKKGKKQTQKHSPNQPNNADQHRNRKKPHPIKIEPALTHFNAADQSTLPGPEWTLGSIKYGLRRRTCWVSPSRKIPFRKKNHADSFESLRKQFDEDEFKAWEEYRKLTSGQDSFVIQPRRYDSPGKTNPHSICCEKQYASLKKVGWTRVGRELGGIATGVTRGHWISPGCKIEFRFPKIALEFEEIRVQCDGDEEMAWERLVKECGRDRIWTSVVGGLSGLERGVESLVDGTDEEVGEGKTAEL